MLNIRKSEERGYNKIDWLESFHSFSFSNYYNPMSMNYSHLRVINEDKVQPGTGFGFHPHKDMEIITFMLGGKIQHKDNLGNIGVLSQGNAQLMRAGTGVVHSEMNPFQETAHLLQIWIHSNEKNLTPGWWEKEFSGKNGIEVIVEPIVKNNQISLLSDSINGNGLKMARNGYILKVSKDMQLDFNKFGISEVYFHQATGESTIIENNNHYKIKHGDAAMGTVDTTLNIESSENSILLVFIFPQE